MEGGPQRPKPRRIRRPPPQEQPLLEEPDDEEPPAFIGTKGIIETRTLSIINLILAIALVIVFLVYALTRPTVRLEPTTLQAARGATSTLPFNLVPDASSTSMTLSLKIYEMEFARLQHYDVCCFRNEEFICRSISKTLGVDAYIASSGQSAIIQNIHPEMVGSSCRLTWSLLVSS